MLNATVYEPYLQNLMIRILHVICQLMEVVTTSI